MSSILKALKKLEAEKALNEEVAGMNVSREILRQQPVNRNTVLLLWLGGIAAVVLIATLSALLLAKPSVQQEKKVAPAAAVPPASAGIRSVKPPASIQREHDGQQIIPASPSPRLPAAAKSSTTEMPASHSPVAETPQAESGRKQPLPNMPEQAESTLTLSGIAWNKDSADRLAIINGQPAATGATVNGVVIEEIMPDRVKVNRAGRSFEIFIGRSALSN